jgi:hypothetical protein
VVVVVVCVAGGGGGIAVLLVVVWRVVVVVAVGSLEQETSIKPRTESAEPSMIAFFITRIVSSNDSLQVASADVFTAKNSSFGPWHESDSIFKMRVVKQGLILLFVVVPSLTAMEVGTAADWPQNYVVHKGSESPDGRYGVLVLSNEAAIKEDQTEGNKLPG